MMPIEALGGLLFLAVALAVLVWGWTYRMTDLFLQGRVPGRLEEYGFLATAVALGLCSIFFLVGLWRLV